MSIKAVSWAFEQRLDDSTAKLVLLGIADKYNEDRGYAWPSIQRLAEMADCTERTVTRKIALLAERGMIKILHDPPQTNRYFLPTLSGFHPDTSGLGNPVQAVEVTLTPDVLQTIDNNNINNKEIIKSFNLFWEVVPKRVGKKSALRAFKTALNDTDAETLIDAMKRYVQLVQDKSIQRQFVLHPTTWLTQGRWEDEAEPDEPSHENFGVTQKWLPTTKAEFDERVMGGMFNYYRLNRPDVLTHATAQGWYDGGRKIC